MAPAFFAGRHGASCTLDQLSQRLVCAGCGAERPAVTACEPEAVHAESADEIARRLAI